MGVTTPCNSVGERGLVYTAIAYVWILHIAWQFSWLQNAMGSKRRLDRPFLWQSWQSLFTQLHRAACCCGLTCHVCGLFCKVVSTGHHVPAHSERGGRNRFRMKLSVNFNQGRKLLFACLVVWIQLGKWTAVHLLLYGSPVYKYLITHSHSKHPSPPKGELHWSLLSQFL